MCYPTPRDLLIATRNAPCVMFGLNLSLLLLWPSCLDDESESVIQLEQSRVIVDGGTEFTHSAIAIADVIAFLPLQVRLAQAELLRCPLSLRLLPLPRLVLLPQLVFL